MKTSEDIYNKFLIKLIEEKKLLKSPNNKMNYKDLKNAFELGLNIYKQHLELPTDNDILQQGLFWFPYKENETQPEHSRRRCYMLGAKWMLDLISEKILKLIKHE